MYSTVILLINRNFDRDQKLSIKTHTIMKTILSIIFFVIIANVSFAQYLWINDPQTGKSGGGTIEETKITYEAQGLFMKVDWEITFTAEGMQYANTDTVEVVYNFVLPAGTVVNDSWLWFGDTILEAMIIDRWSASQVYENIVNRRQDPSILYKHSQTNYQLRIFPMAAKESRKVKISFLLPTDWNQKSVTSEFISENLLLSQNPIKHIEVNAIINEKWGSPVITGEKVFQFEPIEAEDSRITHQRIFSFKELMKNQKFMVSSPMNDGYYLSFFDDGDEQFYQLALNPAEDLNIMKPQKVLFLVDYQKQSSDISQKELLNLLSINFRELLTEKDSFNILYYDLKLQKADDTWIVGDSASIIDAIGNLGDDPFVSYGNLPALLAAAIEIANTNSDVKVVLLANTDKLDDTNSANKLIADLMDLMNPVFPIYIGDFQNQIFRYNYINGANYRGNEYFYRNLAKLTGGDYVHSFDGLNFSDLFKKIYLLATNETGLIDIHTTLDNGFCYGRNKLSKIGGNILNNIYLETGRYSGEFPFEVEISGLYSNKIFSKNLSITKQEAFESDSLTKIFWYGNELQEMENSNNSYSIINDIIDKSIDNRILTYFTAFLCLEPSMMGELDNIAQNNQNKGWVDDREMVVSIDEAEVVKAEVKIYPNPFTDRVNIEIALPKGSSSENTQMEIYDLFGKRIKEFNVDDYIGNTELRIEWDATDNSGNQVTKGTYIFICTTPEGRISKKLVLI